MTNKKQAQVTHFEVSDGDTLILSIANCPIEEQDNEKLNHNGCNLCINGSDLCPNFYKFWSHNGETAMQCAKLSEPHPVTMSPSPINVTEKINVNEEIRRKAMITASKNKIKTLRDFKVEDMKLEEVNTHMFISIFEGGEQEDYELFYVCVGISLIATLLMTRDELKTYCNDIKFDIEKLNDNESILAMIQQEPDSVTQKTWVYDRSERTETFIQHLNDIKHGETYGSPMTVDGTLPNRDRLMFFNKGGRYLVTSTLTVSLNFDYSEDILEQLVMINLVRKPDLISEVHVEFYMDDDVLKRTIVIGKEMYKKVLILLKFLPNDVRNIERDVDIEL